MDCISIQNISTNYNYNPGKTVASPKFGRKTDAQVDTFVLNNKNSKPESKKRNWFGWALAGAVTLLGVASVLL